MFTRGTLFGLLALVLVALPATAQQGWLGIYPDQSQSGVVVEEVVKNSPAAKAGLQKGDRLLAVNGRKLAQLGVLVTFLRDTRPGQEITLLFRARNDDERPTKFFVDDVELIVCYPGPQDLKIYLPLVLKGA